MTEGIATSSGMLSFVEPRFKNIAPYLVSNAAAQLIDFIKSAFEATERTRVPRPDGSVMHCELAVGDSVIELCDADSHAAPRPATVHVYVPNADSAFQRVLRAGATSLEPIADQPWGDRQGCAKDAFGNVWRIATPNGWTPGPEGMRNVQPYLFLHEADKMIPFAEAAFHAVSEGVAKSEGGQVLHATIRIGSGTFEIEEARHGMQPTPCYLHAFVPDADAAYQEAVQAGATSIEAPDTKPYGERSATVMDPFGNTWFLATCIAGSV